MTLSRIELDELAQRLERRAKALSRTPGTPEAELEHDLHIAHQIVRMQARRLGGHEFGPGAQILTLP